jgi:FdhD protein
MCSPLKLEQLAIGFLYNEDLVEGIEDVRSHHISKSSCVELWLNKPFTRPKRKIITAGCGGGITFDDLSKRHEPLHSDLLATTDQLIYLMKELHFGARLYQRSRGIHTAVLADQKNILLQVEDVGRHNCLDRLAGAALFEKVGTQDKILLSSGRISSEMINKARKMGAPIICSRTSPTSLSVALAERWNMTIVAYLRQNRMRVYTHPERIVGLPAFQIGKNGKEEL